MPETKMKTISITLPQEIVDYLDDMVLFNYTTRSAYIRELLVNEKRSFEYNVPESEETC